MTAHHPLRPWMISLGGLAALTLAMFGEVLFSPGERVLSNRNTDLFSQFVHWRAFGFGELRHGHLALWNPHVFSGAPFLGGFQAALLYPPNLLFVLLPLGAAINWSIALHVFLAGAFTYAWAARRGLAPLACFLSACVFMFCGAHFFHIYAGHLPNLCTLTWAPLLFLAMDGLFEEPGLGWSLLGMFALAMQVLAGHPQYVFNTGVAAGIYAALCWSRARRRAGLAIGLAGVVIGGVALSAVQLFPGLAEARETVRSAGLSYEFASKFSFPPENFLTWLTPAMFGNMKSVPYWGRCSFWEASAYIGVISLALAVAGAVWGERSRRRFSVTMVVLLLVLALGRYTPLFSALYHWVPGFDKFRGSGKFVLQASLFLALLAGIGLDGLQRGRRLPGKFAVIVAGAGIVVLALGLWVQQAGAADSAEGAWSKLFLAVRGSGEADLPAAAYEDPALRSAAAVLAAHSLWLSAAALVLVAGLLWVTNLGVAASRPSAANVRDSSQRRSAETPLRNSSKAGKRRGAAIALAVLAIGELFWSAEHSLDTFPVSETVDAGLRQYVAEQPGDYRILNPAGLNMGLSAGWNDLWGEDPSIVRRYAQLLLFAQGENPDDLLRPLHFSVAQEPVYSLMRCRFAFMPEAGRLVSYQFTNPMPHLQLVSRCRVLTRRNDLLATLTNAAFNPREEVILEAAPDPAPHPDANPGWARLTESSTDALTVEAAVSSPSILLITDTYAEGWQARTLTGSSQSHYQVLPADYCLRAVPLAAGKHHFRVEYCPPGFRLGKWISLAFGALFLALVAWHGRRRRAEARLVSAPASAK